MLIEETFAHTDTDGTFRCFSIPRLRELLRLHPDDWQLIDVPINRPQARFIKETRGLDEDRIRSYPMAKLDEPGIICLFADTSQLIVDGNHRLVKRVQRGLRRMLFWQAPEKIWKQALVDASRYADVRTLQRLVPD